MDKNKQMKKAPKVISWTAAIIAAIIMLQTLYFKFIGAPESVFIFSQLNLEPYGRILIGIGEMVASVLIVIPKSRIYGSLLGIGLMSGAVFFHLTKLGIEVMNDGGYLFLLCLIVLIGCSVCLFIERKELKTFTKGIFTSK